MKNLPIIRYSDKTDKELKEMNGMGPDGLLGWLIPETILLKNCTEAANEHDVGYMRAMNLTDKLVADVVFYVNMARIVNNTSCKLLRRRRIAHAKLRFQAVLKLGYEFISKKIKRPKYATATHEAISEYAYRVALDASLTMSDIIANVAMILEVVNGKNDK